jgi:hypothetical protein
MPGEKGVENLADNGRVYFNKFVATFLGNTHKKSIVFYVAILIYSIFLWTQNAQHQTSLFPAMVIGFLIAITIIGIGKELLVWKILETGEEDSTEAAAENSPENDDGGLDLEDSDDIGSVTDREIQINPRSFGFALGTLLAYFLIIQTLGFFASTAVFTFIFMYGSSRNLLRSILGTTILMVALWIIFIEVLNASLLLRFGIFF